MIRTTFTALAVTLSLSSVAGTAGASDDEAQATAGKFLTAGARLFDAKDAQGLAATYTEDAVLTALTREATTRTIKTEVRRGREAIEQAYVDLFKGDATFHARNTLGHVRRIAPDVLVVTGHFEPDAQSGDPIKVPFTQVRVKRGEAWKIASLELLILLEK